MSRVGVPLAQATRELRLRVQSRCGDWGLLLLLILLYLSIWRLSNLLW